MPRECEREVRRQGQLISLILYQVTIAAMFLCVFFNDTRSYQAFCEARDAAAEARDWAQALISARARGIRVRRIVREIWAKAAIETEEELARLEEERKAAELAARPKASSSVQSYIIVRSSECSDLSVADATTPAAH